MAWFDCKFFSDVLGLSCSMYVILPQRTTARQIGVAGAAAGDPGAGVPTLYLLHGLSDDHSIWLRRTGIERYVAGLNLAVVMPAVARSFYSDMAHGGAYWTFLSAELPALCRSFFRLSARREDNFVAGLSMGGYGAFKLALRCPDRFAAAASLSGVLDLGHRIANQQDPAWQHEMTSVFGDVQRFPGSDADVMHLATQAVRQPGDARPRLYACCGDQDFLLDHNRRFARHARGLGLDLAYEEDPGYGHSWDYWDVTIQRVLRWLAQPPGERPASA